MERKGTGHASKPGQKPDLDVFYEGTYSGAEKAAIRVANELEAPTFFDHCPKRGKWVVWTRNIWTPKSKKDKVKRRINKNDLEFYSPGVSAGRAVPGNRLTLVHVNPFYEE